jgi:2-polyprenyl-3-methyl-5-hydroxy-6-metoxy-1,4-benzoquinol methylase
MDPNYFDSRYTHDPAREPVWKAICEYLQRFVAPSSTVMDVGAGYCDFINQIQARTKYAVDSNPETARWCAPGVQFIHATPIEALDLPGQSVDVIMTSNLLEHLTPAQCSVLFDRFDDLLAPAGKLIVIQPNYHYCYRRYWDDFTHVRAFSDVSLRDFLHSRGYRILALEKRFLPFSFKSRLPKSYWMAKLYLASFWRPLAAQMLVVAQR